MSVTHTYTYSRRRAEARICKQISWSWEGGEVESGGATQPACYVDTQCQLN